MIFVEKFVHVKKKQYLCTTKGKEYMQTTMVTNFETKSPQVAAFVKTLQERKMQKLKDLKNKSELYFAK